MEEIKGKVRIVAKTGGIKLENKEEWFNPANVKGKEDIIKNKESLLGKDVVLSLDEKGKVVGYSLQEQEQEVKRPLSDNERVVRENALRHATNIVLAVYTQENEKVSVGELTKVVIEQAKTIAKWILGE